MTASRSTSWVVNPRCLPLRRPSAAHTVELLGQPISSPSFGLVPAVVLAKDPDVRADDGSLVLRDLIDAAEPSGHHAPACQMTLYEVKALGRLTYRFAASIASALQVTRMDTL